MDLPDLLYQIFNLQRKFSKVFLHSSLLAIWNFQIWRWKISKNNFKWGLSCRSVDYYVIRMLYIYQIFILGIWMLLVANLQKLHQIPMDYLCLSICLWMECCRSLQLHIHILPQCSSKCIGKSSIPIRHDAPWYPKVYPDLSKEQVWCFFSIDHLFTGH